MGGAVVVGVEAGFVVSGFVDTLVVFVPDVVGVVSVIVGSFVEVTVVSAEVTVIILFLSEGFVGLFLLLEFC